MPRPRWALLGCRCDPGVGGTSHSHHFGEKRPPCLGCPLNAPSALTGTQRSARPQRPPRNPRPPGKCCSKTLIPVLSQTRRVLCPPPQHPSPPQGVRGMDGPVGPKGNLVSSGGGGGGQFIPPGCRELARSSVPPSVPLWGARPHHDTPPRDKSCPTGDTGEDPIGDTSTNPPSLTVPGAARGARTPRPAGDPRNAGEHPHFSQQPDHPQLPSSWSKMGGGPIGGSRGAQGGNTPPPHLCVLGSPRTTRCHGTSWREGGCWVLNLGWCEGNWDWWWGETHEAAPPPRCRCSPRFLSPQGPQGKPGLPGMPGSDGPPVSTPHHTRTVSPHS